MEKTKLFEEVLFERKYNDVNFSIVPKHPKISRTVQSIVLGFSKQNSFSEQEVVASAASLAWEALLEFKLQDNASWEDVANGQDVHNLNRVVKAICIKLEHELPPIINPNTKRMYDPETGRLSYVTIDFESLDRPIYDRNGSEVGTVMDTVEDSYFAQSYEYARNPFLEWFRKNRDTVLTRRQNDFIDSLSVDMAKDTDYVEVDDFRELAGFDRNNLSHMKGRISDRTLKAWEKLNIGIHDLDMIEEESKWTEFLSIANDDELDTQNKRLTEWLRSQAREDVIIEEKGKKLADKEPVIDFVYDLLTGNARLTTEFATALSDNGKKLSSELLSKVVYAAEERVADLTDALSVESDKAKIKRNPERKAANAARNRKYKEFTDTQPCYVYDAAGALTQTIEPGEENACKIYALDAHGNRNELR
ncbi:hypothetical protein [Terribacillus saccharophilus]|uniref:Uncharacterized protein n=1 Tax=Terribacillus saccharophilus TaxID=361277 RepID=A0ABX4H0D7_9BACI|nr:hypothetical protein [Terribacillus saccharophilus]PAD35963.1 hypothetical protein CHH56_05930 [Terribacillus saccharophilus]PAD96987.1 hypothetical protein CHH50_06380 [Terribacillus saccharophilus]PAE00563.1 hypothetical protein CHH48_07285 [Terribacillus saccharophilus]